MERIVEQESLIEDTNKKVTKQASGSGKNSVSLQETVQGRAVAQVVNGVNFATGLAWSASLLAIIAPHHERADEDPHHIDGHRSAFLIWSCSLILVFIVLSVTSIKFIQGWQKKAQEAILEEDMVTAIRYRRKEMSLTTLVKWGLGSCVGDLVNQIVKGFIPVDQEARLIWFLVSVAINLLLVLMTRCYLKAQGFEDDKLPTDRSDVEGTDGSFLRVSCDIWFSTGALISALAFLDFVEIWFRIDPTLARSTDVVMLYIFSIVAVGAAGVLLAILQNADKTDAIQSHQLQRAKVGLYFRKFVAKLVTMCAATIVYLLIYVSLVELQFKVEPGSDIHSIYDPLPLWSAAILLVSALIINLTVGLFIERSLKAIGEALAAVPRDAIPGVADDAILAVLQSIAQSTSASYIQAFGWLIGNAFHKFFIAVWQHQFGAPAGNADWITSSLGYTSILTCLALLTSLRLPPAPKEI